MSKYKAGQIVLLSNSNTRYGFNAIAEHYWGKETVILEECPRILSEPTYYIGFGREKFHVVESMLSDPSGPW